MSVLNFRNVGESLGSVGGTCKPVSQWVPAYAGQSMIDAGWFLVSMQLYTMLVWRAKHMGFEFDSRATESGGTSYVKTGSFDAYAGYGGSAGINAVLPSGRISSGGTTNWFVACSVNGAAASYGHPPYALFLAESTSTWPYDLDNGFPSDGYVVVGSNPSLGGPGTPQPNAVTLGFNAGVIFYIDPAHPGMVWIRLDDGIFLPGGLGVVLGNPPPGASYSTCGILTIEISGHTFSIPLNDGGGFEGGGGTFYYNATANFDTFFQPPDFTS